MRGLFRWAFNGAAVVSAVLFVAACVMWVRGHWWLDVAVACFGDVTRSNAVEFNPERAEYDGSTGLWLEVESATGVVSLDLIRFHCNPGGVGGWRAGSYRMRLPDGSRRSFQPYLDSGFYAAGLQFDRSGNEGFTDTYFVIPCWIALLLTLLLPAWVAGRRLRSRCSRPGLCPSCGYDVRATPNRCPECGTVLTGAVTP